LLDHCQAASFLLLCNFGEIDWYLRGGNTNRDAIDDPAGNEHALAVAGHLNGSSNQLEETGDEDRVTTANSVRQRASDDRADD